MREAAEEALQWLHDLSEEHWSGRDSMGGVEYIVVTVKDPGDLVLGVSPHESRFEFRPADGEDFEQLAWECASSAVRAGFGATAERVGVYKDAATR